MPDYAVSLLKWTCGVVAATLLVAVLLGLISYDASAHVIWIGRPLP